MGYNMEAVEKILSIGTMGQTEAIIKIILLLLTVGFGIWMKFKQKKIAHQRSKKIAHEAQSELPSDNSTISGEIRQSESEIDDILND